MTASDAHLHGLQVRWSFLATVSIEPGEHKSEPSKTLKGEGDPLLAVDSDRVRCLLVPVPEPQVVPREASGAAIRITSPKLTVDGRRGWFLRVACIEPSLFDRFAMLVADVLEAIAASPKTPGPATLGIVGEWQELLRADSARASREALAGLMGELLFLEEVLDADPATDLDCWVGPSGQRHDFLRGSIAVEVKTTLTHAGRRASIHGVDQLEPQVEGGSLFMSWNRLEVAVGTGDTVGEVLNRIKGKTVYSAALAKKVATFKFDPAHDSAQVRFIVRERFLFAIGGDFPRLTRSQLVGGHEMAGVGALAYEIDLATAGVHPLSREETAIVIRAIGSGA